jgi:glucose-6-phosphate isomerase
VAARSVPKTLTVKQTIAGSEFLADKSLQDILLAEARATFAALASQGHPCSFLSLDDMSAESIASLLVQLMSATVIGSALYDVDPFDQPAVELGKRIALGLLGHAKHKAEAEAMAKFLP